MLGLPVIVAAGGINSAGRTSGNYALKRMLIDALPVGDRESTLAALGAMTGETDAERLTAQTLVRRIESRYFDIDAVRWNRRVTLSDQRGPVTFETSMHTGADAFPKDWKVEEIPGRKLRITVATAPDVLFPSTRRFEVGSAGQLPTGFEPGDLYPSRNHPRGLQMTVYAASDALADLGIDWDAVCSRVSPDAISVYASSSMGQLDDDGSGGMLRSRADGRRVTSKQCALGFAEMPGDFINAYVLGALGSTGPALGACATFLYNLRLAVQDIRSGRARVAVVAAAEAPINPQVMDGYNAMGALATAAGLRQLDGIDLNVEPDWRRACRPFGDNCGFTIAESAQVVVLFDDALALELGAPIRGAVPDVFVHADGAKKSISSPGAGNYLTFARAMASLRAILGDQGLKTGGLVQAHGTGTPQNRVTESQIMSRIATAFGLDALPVAAIKSYVGHSLGAAAGDQLSATLGIWEQGMVPGIGTVAALADDVATQGLDFVCAHRPFSDGRYALINSKGFGGNNATAAVLSPTVTQQLLAKHHGAAAMQNYGKQAEQVARQRTEVESARLAGSWSPTYRFNEGVLADEDIAITADRVELNGTAVALKSDIPEGWRLN
jgi:acetoacetyl-[acyl-carrier protein] synthase